MMQAVLYIRNLTDNVGPDDFRELCVGIIRMDIRVRECYMLFADMPTCMRNLRNVIGR